jgi:hypothetical protein
VFHSVAWQASRAGRQGDGEADFILLHEQHGLLILEVKGGRVVVEDGRWFSIDRNDIRHSIKDPFRQATDSKYALLRYLRDIRSIEIVPQVHHAVVFPDIFVEGNIGLHPREIILDGSDLADIVPSVDRVLRHWGSYDQVRITDTSFRMIVGLLAPTVHVHSMLRSSIAASERQLLTLTQRQVDTMAMLRSVRRCVVRGSAGTGKSLLATASARRLSAEGARTLLVSYNAPVAENLIASLRDVTSVTVSTFHSLCLRLARSSGQLVPGVPDDVWFDTRSAEVLVASIASCSENDKYDCLLVDEAQDFTDDWLIALMLLLRDPDEGPVSLFLDNHQQIYRSAMTFPQSWPVLELDQNCRNALPIARVVASCFSDPPPRDGAMGPEVSFVEADSGLLLDIVHDVVRRLLVEDSLSPEQLVVLSNTRELVTRLRTMLVGPAAFVELGGVGVISETVQRYKGLEAEVVVLALSGRPIEHAEALDRALLYVGLSRARSALFVIASSKWLYLCRTLTASCR